MIRLAMLAVVLLVGTAHAGLPTPPEKRKVARIAKEMDELTPYSLDHMSTVVRVAAASTSIHMYVIINHTTQELDDMGMYKTLRKTKRLPKQISRRAPVRRIVIHYHDSSGKHYVQMVLLIKKKWWK